MRRFTGLYYKLGPENYGTSVACARLSGRLALIRSAIPDLTYAEFTDAVNRAAMLSCADDVTLAGGPGVVGELHGYRTFKLIEHLRAGGPLDLEKAREHWERGRKHFESGRYEQAAREFETATELVPTSHIAFHDLALACHRLGRPRIAEDFLNEAIRLHWAVAAAHNDLGTIFQAGGQLEVALEHYRMALFIEPGLEAAAMNESAVAGALQSRRAGLDRLAKAGAIVLDGPFIQNEQ
jgi:tetratricopeptide (TPR) repeat protein